MDVTCDALPCDATPVLASTRHRDGIFASCTPWRASCSNGTIVYAGRFKEKPCAVKRMHIAFMDMVEEEMSILLELGEPAPAPAPEPAPPSSAHLFSCHQPRVLRPCETRRGLVPAVVSRHAYTCQ